MKRAESLVHLINGPRGRTDFSTFETIKSEFKEKWTFLSAILQDKRPYP